jgi:integrase
MSVYELPTVLRLLKQPIPKELRVAVALAAFAGLRLAELQGLRWEDIDFEENAITVKRTIWHGHEDDPKSAASAASVTMIRELRTVLEEYKTAGDQKLFESDLKALGRYHLPEAFTAVESQWRGWHGFRRGFASTLYELGADGVIVQRILRHARVIVTREHYIERFDRRLLKAMTALQGASKGR